MWLVVIKPLLVLVNCGFMGCFSTHLPTLDAPPELIRLEHLAHTHLNLTIEVSEVTASSMVGLQYILGFLPITRVYTSDLTQSVDNLVRLEAGLRGVACTASSANTPHLARPPKRGIPTLTIVVDDLSVNGYDLLVLRRPSASITLTGYLTSGPPETLQQRTLQCSAVAEESFSSSYAFEDELNEALRRAIIRAAGMVLDCLGNPRM